MLHLSLALYIVSFSMGIAVLILCFFAHATYRDRAFLRLAMLFGSIVILLVVSVLTTYNRVVPGEFGLWFSYAVPTLSAVGSALFAYSAPTIVLDATFARASPTRNAVLVLFVVLMAGLGAFRDWVAHMPVPELGGAVFSLILIYAVVVLFRGLPRIENVTLRAFFRQLAILVLLMTVLGILEMAARRAFRLPQFFQEFPLVEIVSFLCVIALMIFYAARFLMKEPVANACVLTEEFVRTYGISPRECQIVSMMIQGFNNRMIGERLFISTATVKNHVYHIYQKTGAANKIQLMNLINPPK